MEQSVVVQLCVRVVCCVCVCVCFSFLFFFADIHNTQSLELSALLYKSVLYIHYSYCNAIVRTCYFVTVDVLWRHIFNFVGYGFDLFLLGMGMCLCLGMGLFLALFVSGTYLLLLCIWVYVCFVWLHMF